MLGFKKTKVYAQVENIIDMIRLSNYVLLFCLKNKYKHSTLCLNSEEHENSLKLHYCNLNFRSRKYRYLL